MKKLPFLALLLAFVFVGCSGDDDNGNDGNGGNGDTAATVVGSWKLIGWVDNDVNPPVFHAEEECFDEVFTFNANNTGVAVVTDCEFPTETSNFTWNSPQAGVLFLSSGGFDETVNVSFHEGNNKMHIVYPGDGEDADVYERQ